MTLFKPVKFVGTLFLGASIVGLSACGQEPDTLADAEDPITIGTAATTSASSTIEAPAESPVDQNVETTPVVDAPAPERRPANPAASRPSPAPTTGSTSAPAPAEPDVISPPDPHAGHDMGSMSGHDMDNM